MWKLFLLRVFAEYNSCAGCPSCASCWSFAGSDNFCYAGSWSLKLCSL